MDAGSGVWGAEWIFLKAYVKLMWIFRENCKTAFPTTTKRWFVFLCQSNGTKLWLFKIAQRNEEKSWLLSWLVQEWRPRTWWVRADISQTLASEIPRCVPGPRLTAASFPVCIMWNEWLLRSSSVFISPTIPVSWEVNRLVSWDALSGASIFSTLAGPLLSRTFLRPVVLHSCVPQPLFL